MRDLDRHLARIGLSRASFAAIKQAGGDYAHRDRGPLSKLEFESALKTAIKNAGHRATFMDMLANYGIIKGEMIDLMVSPDWKLDS